MTGEHTDGSKTCCVKYTKAIKGTNSVSKGDNSQSFLEYYKVYHISNI